MSPRRILHVDMDAFFASIEQRDDPELRGRPVVVGGRPPRGVVAAASYEARVYGIRSAMPSADAVRRCPELVFRPSRFELYRREARRIREIFLRYTPLVEPLSLDEAYLDVTRPLRGPPSGTLAARAVKDDILRETGLTASAGVATSKFVAKVASARDKPGGLTVVHPEEAPRFIASLSIEDFPGVGPRTAERMRALGIETGAHLRERPVEELFATSASGVTTSIPWPTTGTNGRWSRNGSGSPWGRSARSGRISPRWERCWRPWTDWPARWRDGWSGRGRGAAPSRSR